MTDATIIRDPLPVTEATFKLLTDAMPQMVWSTLPDGFHDYYNERWYEFTGVPRGSTDGEAWAGMFHADDQPGAWTRWRHSLETGDPYEVEYRLRHHSGAYRWTIGRAQPVRDEAGRIVRWIGTCTDIHDAKLIAEMNELLSRELSHRIKNIFSVVASLISLSAREFPESKPFAMEFRERVASLGRAHEFVRPHSENSRPTIGQTTLHGLLNSLFAPYPASSQGQLSVTGDDVVVDDRGATPIALLFHELATNAVKYGSLSSPDGRVDVTVRRDGKSLSIRWAETLGPLIESTFGIAGFGTRLAEVSVERQLGGTLVREWKREGLVVDATIDVARLARPEPRPA